MTHAESMQGIISKIETEDMTNRDSQVIIGDSALTGNALYGLKVIMNRCKLALEPLMVKTVSTDISCSVNIASEKLFPCLSLLEAALNSLCLGKYAVTSKDNIASVESRKRKASFLNVQLYLGANSQKRKLQPGSVSLR